MHLTFLLVRAEMPRKDRVNHDGHHREVPTHIVKTSDPCHEVINSLLVVFGLMFLRRCLHHDRGNDVEQTYFAVGVSIWLSYANNIR